MTLDEARREANKQSWTSWSKRHVIQMPVSPDQYFVVTDSEWMNDSALDDAVLIATYDPEDLFH